jgi:hypothetical protein
MAFSEDGGQRSEVRGQKSEIRVQNTEVRKQTAENGSKEIKIGIFLSISVICSMSSLISALSSVI